MIQTPGLCFLSTLIELLRLYRSLAEPRHQVVSQEADHLLGPGQPGGLRQALPTCFDNHVCWQKVLLMSAQED